MWPLLHLPQVYGVDDVDQVHGLLLHLSLVHGIDNIVHLLGLEDVFQACGVNDVGHVIGLVDGVKVLVI